MNEIKNKNIEWVCQTCGSHIKYININTHMKNQPLCYKWICEYCGVSGIDIYKLKFTKDNLYKIYFICNNLDFRKKEGK